MARKWTEEKAEKGRRFKEERKRSGITQKDMGELLGYRVDTKCQSISNIEAGLQDLTEDKAKEAAKIFKVNPEYLLGLTSFRTNQEAFKELVKVDWSSFVNESERTEKEWKAIEGIQSRYGLEKVPSVDLTGSEVDAGLMQVQANGKIYFCTEYDYNKMRSDIYRYVKSRTEDFIRDLKRINDPDLIELSANLTALQMLKDKLQS